MSVSYLTALVTFAAGFLLLLGWAYLTTDNPRSNRLLAKSLWLFVLPSAALWALPDRIYAFPLSMWVASLVEECLKLWGASTEPKTRDKFWLVALFGIWELMLAKAVWSVTGGQIPGDWGRSDILVVAIAAAVVVLMHSLTAVIYAFHFQGRPWLALLAAWALHTIFNESADLLGISPMASVARAIPLLILLLALWPDSSMPSATKGEASD